MTHALTEVVLTIRAGRSVRTGRPRSQRYVSLTLTKPAIPTKITPTRMFQLAAAFGADADHRGHDGAGNFCCARALLFAESAGGIGMTFQTPVGDHDAFGY